MRKIIKIKRKADRTANPVSQMTNPETITDEVFAAVSTVVHLYITQEEAHDVENTVLTINKVARAYSPWSSKIYGLREIPRKR